MALPPLGPQKNLKKKSLYKNAANGEKYIPELQSQKKFNSELCDSLEKVTTTIRNIRIALSRLLFHDEC